MKEINIYQWIPAIISACISAIALIWVAIINARVKKKQYIHEIQFRKEFDVYERLWEVLIEFRNAVGGLRPMMDNWPDGKSENDIMKERTREAWKLYNKIILEYWKQKPFYSPAVFTTINSVLKIGASETIEYEHMILYRRNLDDYKKAAVHLEDIASHLDKIDSSIRERIKSHD